MGRYDWFRIVTFLSTNFSRQSLYWIARRVGRFNYTFDGRGRRAVQENLRVVMGPDADEARVRRTALLVFQSFGKYLAEFFGYGRFGGEFVDRHMGIEGEEHIDRALRAGRGAVVVSAHLSNWEIGAAKLSRVGYPVIAVAQLHPEPEVNELFRRQRASRGYFTIPVEGAYRRCIRILRENKLMCFIGERNVGEGGIEVEFFGRPTLMPHGPARIALAAGAPMIPAFIIRRPDDDLKITLAPPVEAPAGGDRRSKAHEMTQGFARMVERYVRKHPEQWGVFFRVWPGEKDRKDAADEEAALAGGPVWGRGTSTVQHPPLRHGDTENGRD